MMSALTIVLVILSCSTLAQTLFTQSVGVKGVLMCGDKPLANTKVKLYDDDSGPDLDDLLAEGTTDSMGQFLLYGHTSEIMTIDPKLNVYHDCDDSLVPCQRKVTFHIPKSFVSSGEQPKTFFNIGQVNMQIQFESESRDCLHRMLFLLALLAFGEALMHIRDPSTWPHIRKSGKLHFPRKASYKWSEEWLENVPVDHFSFGNKDEFKLRYFINTDSYEEGGPIFFYTGNEGKLEGFAQNTGFMWDIAPEFKAAVVFAEHRFYGKTQPYGDKSYNTTEHLGYLSSEQALADFVLLIDYLKQKRLKGAENSAVIAFGGSYGGMLSAWIRIKYPHKVDGAIAASAPVFWFMDTNVPEDIYDMIVTRSFVNAGCNRKAVEKGWRALQNLAQSDDGRKYLNDLFHLEEKSRIESQDDHLFLRAFVREVFESMAMVNYPYPSEFLSPLPGWPVKEACKFLSAVPKTDEEAARQLYEVTNLYYNHTGTAETFCANAERCSGAFAALGDPMGWPWQSCTEMVMPLCGSGWPNDFFWKDCPFTVEGATQNCKTWFEKIGFDRSMLRPHWATQNYGATFPTASNIVFSNGYLDPWSGGGWSLKPKTEGSLVSIILKEGAHHYDLRGEHPDDTEEVREVRRVEKSHIKKWIQKAKRN